MLLLQLHPISIFPIVKEKYFKNKSSLRKIAFIHLLRFLIQEHQYPPFILLWKMCWKNYNKTLLPNRQYL